MPRRGTGQPARPAAELRWEQVRAFRLARQRLDRRAPASEALAIVADLGGLHAQILSSAVLTLWARVADLAPGAVERALWVERSLVKTWAMRGTLHLLPAAEFGLWQAALADRAARYGAAWQRYFHVTGDDLEQAVAAIAEALRGRQLTREELAAAVVARTGSDHLGELVRHSWGVLLKQAALRGQLCFAPGNGAAVRFTHPADWLPEPTDPPPSSAEAPRIVARRFLVAHGPAGREDVGRWWGIAPAAAGRLLAELGDEIVPVVVEGRPAWLLADDLPAIQAATLPGSVRLLPAFDQYVVGATRHARCLMPGDFTARVYRPQGWLSPVLLVDGQMAGTWHHERQGSRLAVTIAPFAELPAWARRAAEAEAERLAVFLGGRLDLRWSTPTDAPPATAGDEDAGGETGLAAESA